MSFPSNPSNNDSYKGFIYDAGRWRKMDKVFSLGAVSLDFTANIPVKVFDLGDFHAGAYALEITWSYFYNSTLANRTAGATVIWYGGATGMVSLHSNFQVYNAASPLELKLNATAHHYTQSIPSFALDSDNSAGDYGRTSIFMTPSFSGCVLAIAGNMREVL